MRHRGLGDLPKLYNQLFMQFGLMLNTFLVGPKSIASGIPHTCSLFNCCFPSLLLLIFVYFRVTLEL